MNEEIIQYLHQILHQNTNKIILSNPKKKEQEYIKVVIDQNKDVYVASKYTKKQVFHDHISKEDLLFYCQKQMEDFKQFNAWDEANEYSIKISKKGKCLFTKGKAAKQIKVQTSHNRSKNYYLEEGEIIPPLVDMGIFTKEGKIVHSMYDKYKQIQKFIEIIDDAVKKYDFEELHIIDFGCGKSYLTFIVYYYLYEKKGINVHITGLDLKEEVIENCNKAAKKYGYQNLNFEVGDINGYQSDTTVDMVLSLHACDTATDFALFNAISWKAKIIISVPCCQHELSNQMDSQALAVLQRYGIIKERSAALFTDAIRGNLLGYLGYKTQLLEFVDLSHTPKNILIRATKTNMDKSHKMKLLEEVEALMKEFHLNPTFYQLLKEHKYI